VEGIANPINEILRVYKEHGLTGPVAYEGSSALLFQEGLARHGIKLIDGKFLMAEARMVKNKDEIDCIRMSCSAAEHAFGEMKRAIKPGIRENELMGIGAKALYDFGCDEVQEFVIASGPRTNPLHIDFTSRAIRPGDMVLIDVNACCYMGYKTCYYRSFVCGTANGEQKDCYRRCRDYLYDSMRDIKAGISTAEVAGHWSKDPVDWGLPPGSNLFGLAAGHGIGISLHEKPFFNLLTPPEDHIILEEGMVIALETYYGRPNGYHGARLEECIAITKDGYDLLTHWPYEEITEYPL